MIAIKDMAGLLKPAHAAPMIQVIRSLGGGFPKTFLRLMQTYINHAREVCPKP